MEGSAAREVVNGAGVPQLKKVERSLKKAIKMQERGNSLWEKAQTVTSITKAELLEDNARLLWGRARDIYDDSEQDFGAALDLHEKKSEAISSSGRAPVSSWRFEYLVNECRILAEDYRSLLR
jgi:hypothetical protein